MMAEQGKRQFKLHQVYVKDLSFEAPGSPEVFREDWKPSINVQLGNKARRLGDGGEYEVEVSATITATRDEKTLYLAEAVQAGIFTVSGMGEEELDQILGAYCPSTLFPYLRELLGSLVSRGGFPQFHLQPINFDALYLEARAKKAEQGEATH
jgi:preprotein translocase subunit SecB